MAFSAATTVYSTAGEQYPDFFNQPLLSSQVITASGNAGVLALPQILSAAKARLVVVASAVSGTTPSLTLNLFESVDGTNFNGSAALTSGAITANGTTYTALVNGPFYPQMQVAYTVSGTTPSFTLSAYLLVWNK